VAKMVGAQQYRWIPPGTFAMGCGSCAADEKPVHTVAIPRGFWMAATEDHNGPLPRLGMSWKQALASCVKIGGRLPTEAEWEYAARGGEDGPAYGQLDDIAWYLENSGGEVHPVRKKKPNKYGLYDMLGNAAEWVLDRYYNQYDLAAPAIGPNIERPLRGNAMGTLRGGFWETPASELRVTRRAPRPPDEPEGMIGFRCVLDP
jgi:formylglycine-generating enzyme required for sulfatase activity